MYHGFRFVRVDVRVPSNSMRGRSNTPDPAVTNAHASLLPLSAPPSVTGLFMRSDVEVHGRVVFGGGTGVTKSSHHHPGGGGGDQIKGLRGRSPTRADVLNTVQKCIVHTQLDNLHSIPTDCPQREKRGWMGDAQWTSEEASLNIDMQSLCVLSLSERASERAWLV